MRSLLLVAALSLPITASAQTSIVGDRGRPAAPVGNAFTYQGNLESNGVPADGAFDFEFVLLDEGGATIAGPLCLNDIPVDRGVFTVVLDFGPAYTGDQRALGVSVRPGAAGDCAGGDPFTAILPPQDLTPAPYASGLVFPFFGETTEGPFAFAVRQAGGSGSAAMYGVTGTPIDLPFSLRAGVRGDASDSTQGNQSAGLVGVGGPSGYAVFGFNDAPSAVGVFGWTAGDNSTAVSAFTSGSVATALFTRAGGPDSTAGLALVDGPRSTALSASANGPDSFAIQAFATDPTSTAGQFTGGLVTDRLKVVDGATAGTVLTSDADGNATWQPPLGITSTSTSANSPNPTSTLQFLSPTRLITITEERQVFVTASRAFGSTVGAGGLRLWIGFQGADGVINSTGNGLFDLQVPANTRVPMSLSDILTLFPGTYEVGMVGRSTQAANWDSNDFGYTSVIILP